QAPEAGGADFGCGMGRTLVCVTAYGDVLPCPTLPLAAGNVREEALKRIWEGAPVLAEVRRYPDVTRMGPCLGCALRAYCRRCPGSAYTETGDLYAPAPSACREAVVRVRLERERGGEGVAEGVVPAGLAGGAGGGRGAPAGACGGTTCRK
ncbi:MAG: SPASM domain-containing protein, partial [Planctomycetota bacterium]